MGAEFLTKILHLFSASLKFCLSILQNFLWSFLVIYQFFLFFPPCRNGDQTLFKKALFQPNLLQDYSFFYSHLLLYYEFFRTSGPNSIAEMDGGHGRISPLSLGGRTKLCASGPGVVGPTLFCSGSRGVHSIKKPWRFSLPANLSNSSWSFVLV